MNTLFMPIPRVLLSVAFSLLTATAALALDPAGAAGAVRSPALDPDRAVSLRNIELEVGIAVMEIDNGVLIPTRAIDGRTMELVFIGEARFLADPADNIEAEQLELFTGQRYLDVTVEEAVLVFSGQATVEMLLQRPAPGTLQTALLQRAEKLLAEWVRKADRRNAGIEQALFKSLMGDPAFAGYFAVWCHSQELGDFVYQLDPENVEHLSLTSFIPLDVDGWERRRLKRHIRIQQRKGRWLGVSVQDLGAWDVWLSAPWQPGPSVRFPGNVGFEAERYTLDVTIKRRTHAIEGAARLELKTIVGGRRVVTLELYRDLLVRSVKDGEGNELFFFRSDREISVVLPRPSVAGEDLVLDVAYGGRALKWVGRGTFDLEDTSNWYPHCGSVDRAVYDVTLRWPAKYELVSGGRLVESGRAGKYRWERRTLEIPSISVSFVMGDFLVERRRSGDVELTLAFNRSSPVRLTERIRERVFSAVDRSLRYFEEAFGPYPLDRLAVAMLPRDFSQSYPGFITLTDSVISLDPTRPQMAADWFQNTTIAHEVAHQWWGNLIGWWSYRDQWLSEAMANYSAMIFYREQEGIEAADIADLSAGWRDSLGRATIDGRTIESLGPIVLGARLNSSLANNGYRAIVYRKGAMVLAMLARAVGEQRFLEMLRSVVDAAAHRVISTEDFLSAVERMSGLELDGFARQFIYGTGIPHIYYDYEQIAAEEGWVVRGEAVRFEPPHYELWIDDLGAGGWDVRREVRKRFEDESATVSVPFRLSLEDGFRAGTLLMRGERTEFEIASTMRPTGLKFDPGEEILARFYFAADHPKRVSRYRALAYLQEGRFDLAEAEFKAALQEPLGADGLDAPLPWLNHPENEMLQEDARIRLVLARMYIDQRRDEEALAELDAVEEMLESNRATFRMARDTLRSRLDILGGDYLAAYKRLKQTMKLAAPRRGARTWRASLWKAQLSGERLAMTEAYALLAIAAYETGNMEDFRWALQEAEERGVEVFPLILIAREDMPSIMAR
jgi:hypothetical protein